MKTRFYLYPLFFLWFVFNLQAQDSAQENSEDAIAEEEISPFQQELMKMNWQHEGEGQLDDIASISIPEGYSFIQGQDTRRLMEMFGNIPSNLENGLICPLDLSWFVVFEFTDDGYVKDDEKDSLDADAILKDLQARNKMGNEQRKKMGLETLTILGWAMPPKYNEVTNNLEWATRLQGEQGDITVNYFTKLLGRYGIMNATLVCSPDSLEAVLPDYQSLLTHYHYNSGKTYAEFQRGDKVAQYGLTGLIAGGALFAAAKTGLLAKLGKFLKPILIGVAVVFGAIAKFFKRLFGRA